MTRIDFYGLAEVRPEAREKFAVRLVIRAWREGMRSMLLVPDDAGRERLGEALWSEPGAFLPHADVEAEDAATTPVLIATPERLSTEVLVGQLATGMLVNLTDTIPECFAAFDRVAEILCHDDTMRERGREHYRFYRERGYPLDYHDLTEAPRR